MRLLSNRKGQSDGGDGGVIVMLKDIAINVGWLLLLVLIAYMLFKASSGGLHGLGGG